MYLYWDELGHSRDCFVSVFITASADIVSFLVDSSVFRRDLDRYFIFFNERFFLWFARSRAILLSVSRCGHADSYLLLSIYLSLKRNRKLRYFMVLCGGILLFIVADCLYVYAVFHGSFVPNTLIDAGYCLAATIIGIGALLYAKDPYEPQAYGSDFDSMRGIVNRALVLTLISVLAIVIGKPVIEEVFFFSAVIIVHQLISR
jgi:hypothetical protein